MHLTPCEQEKLLSYVAAQVEKDRKARGSKLNHSKSLAYLTAALLLAGCATTRYEPLGEARSEEIEQINDSTFRVEYRVSPFTSQDALDEFLLRRCADVTLQHGYDYFAMTEKYIVLSYHRSTSVTLQMFKGQKPAGGYLYHDAKEELGSLNKHHP